jgi:hypothetical protein
LAEPMWVTQIFQITRLSHLARIINQNTTSDYG